MEELSDYIPQLTAIMRRYGIARLEYEKGGRRLDLELWVDAAPEVFSTLHETVVVRAPAPGKLLRQHPASGQAAPAPDEVFAEGDVLGYLQDDLVLLPIRNPIGGRLVAVLAEDGAVVGYGLPLFEILPTHPEDNEQNSPPAK